MSRRVPSCPVEKRREARRRSARRRFRTSVAVSARAPTGRRGAERSDGGESACRRCSGLKARTPLGSQVSLPFRVDAVLNQSSGARQHPTLRRRRGAPLHLARRVASVRGVPPSRAQPRDSNRSRARCGAPLPWSLRGGKRSRDSPRGVPVSPVWLTAPCHSMAWGVLPPAALGAQTSNRDMRSIARS